MLALIKTSVKMDGTKPFAGGFKCWVYFQITRQSTPTFVWDKMWFFFPNLSRSPFQNEWETWIRAGVQEDYPGLNMQIFLDFKKIFILVQEKIWVLDQVSALTTDFMGDKKAKDRNLFVCHHLMSWFENVPSLLKLCREVRALFPLKTTRFKGISFYKM